MDVPWLQAHVLLCRSVRESWVSESTNQDLEAMSSEEKQTTDYFFVRPCLNERPWTVSFISFTVITVYMSSKEDSLPDVLWVYAHVLLCGVGRSCSYLVQSLQCKPA